MIKIRKARDADFEDVWDIFHQVVKREIPLPLILNQPGRIVKHCGCSRAFLRMQQSSVVKLPVPIS